MAPEAGVSADGACAGCAAGWPLSPRTDYFAHVQYEFDLSALHAIAKRGLKPNALKSATYIPCARRI